MTWSHYCLFVYFFICLFYECPEFFEKTYKNDGIYGTNFKIIVFFNMRPDVVRKLVYW